LTTGIDSELEGRKSGIDFCDKESKSKTRETSPSRERSHLTDLENAKFRSSGILDDFKSHQSHLGDCISSEKISYSGIGAWALQTLGYLPTSAFIDFSLPDLFSLCQNDSSSNIKQHAGISRQYKSTESSAQSSQNETNTGSSKGKSPQKRTFGDEKDPGDDENGEDDGDPERPKKARTKDDFGPHQGQRFACPYYKNIRTCARHPGCASMSFPATDLARLKYVILTNPCRINCDTHQF
jgi:hypothetical protein